MLKIKRIDKIRSLYHDDGLSFAQISRRLHIAPNTVSKYVKLDDFSGIHKSRADAYIKILPYEEYITSLLANERNSHHKQRLTGRKVFEMLNKEYQDFPCSYSLTLRFFGKKRCEFYNLSVKKQHIPLKHLPGSAQVDVGDLYYLDTNGEKQKGYLITMAFPYSNAVYGQVFKGKSSECILQGLKNVFLHIGGVPYEITFDNDKALVKICEGQQTNMLTDLFLRFKNHYNFRTHFCNLHSPNEKANVEVGIRALRIKEFSPMSVIADFDEFNCQLLSLCDNAQERIRRGYKMVQITDMFTTDRQNLMPLPTADFEVQTSRKRICDTMGRIIIGGNCNYFLSPEFGKKKVIVKTTYNRIYFYDEYERPISNCLLSCFCAFQQFGV
jgi:transposase